MRDLQDAVIVITGASSGIGREAAVQLAERGARLVLAARRRESLEETARLCRDAGGRALVVVTDVTKEADVDRLAAAAIAEWGRIDVWVNNAGVTLFALLDQGPFEEHRRVIETNVLGAMLGARAVMPIFRRQRRGILINVGSIVSKIGQPFVPSYAISKFAVRGLTDSLRIEVADEPDIEVCSLLPYAVDTPHFEEGATTIGLEARAMPPVQPPEKVARALVELIERPQRERHVPRVAELGYAVHRVFPRTVERLIWHALCRWHFDETPEKRSTGSLFRPAPEGGTVHGTRLPQLGGPAFAAWIAADLFRTGAQSVGRFVRSKVAARR